jgi:hypothetical protein
MSLNVLDIKTYIVAYLATIREVRLEVFEVFTGVFNPYVRLSLGSSVNSVVYGCGYSNNAQLPQRGVPVLKSGDCFWFTKTYGIGECVKSGREVYSFPRRILIADSHCGILFSINLPDF